MRWRGTALGIFIFQLQELFAQINDAPLDYSNQIGKSHML